MYTLPSIVNPADIDFLASISMKLLAPLINCGKDIFVYDPRPNYPLRPNPHEYNYVFFFYFNEMNPTGIIILAATNALKRYFECI